MSTTYHITLAELVGGTSGRVHPRICNTRAERLRRWAEKHNVSLNSAAAAFLNLALVDDGLRLEFRIANPEALSVALGVLQELAACLRASNAALARPRPAGGDALRAWQDQQKIADAALHRVEAAVDLMLRVQELPIGDLISFAAARIAERSEPKPREEGTAS